MLKLTIAVLAVGLAGSASAAGWRSLRVDASSEARFTASVAQFKAKLPSTRYQVFLRALEDVWEQGTKNAEAQQSEYTADDYRRQLDGLAYQQVVTLTDPTGDTARLRLRAAIASAYGAPRPGTAGSSWAPQAGTLNAARNDPPARQTHGNPDAAREAGY